MPLVRFAFFALILCVTLLPSPSALADEAPADQARPPDLQVLADSYAAHTAAAQMSLEFRRPLEARLWMESIPMPSDTWDLGFLRRSAVQYADALEIQGVLDFDVRPRTPQFLISTQDGGILLADESSSRTFGLPDNASPARQVESLLDGSAFLALSDDGLRRIDLESGAISAPLHLEGRTTRLAVSPDGKIAAVGAWRRHAETGRPEGLLHLVDTETLELRATRDFGYIVSAVAWDVQGERIVGCTWNATCAVWRSDQPTPRLTFELEADEGYPAVQDVAFSPDGHQIAVGTKEGVLRLFDSSSGELLRLLDLGRAAWVNAVAYWGDGMVAAGTSDGRIGVFDTETGESLGELYGATSAIRRFRLQGDRLVTGEESGRLKLWERPPRQRRDRLVHRSEDGTAENVWALDVSVDGSRAVTASSAGVIRMWRIHDAKEIWRVAGHDEEASGVLLFDDPATGETRVASGANDGRLRLWHGETGDALGNFESIDDGRAIGMAVSPDGNLLAAGSSRGSAKVWDLREGPGSDPVATLEGHGGEIWRILWDARQLITTSRDGTFRVWDPETWELRRSVPAHDGAIHGAATSPDGMRLATAGADGKVRLWALPDGARLVPEFHHAERVYDVAWSPDGARLATVSEDFTAKIWSVSGDLPTRRPLLTFHYDHQVYQAHWSRDGATLFILPMDGIVRILSSH